MSLHTDSPDQTFIGYMALVRAEWHELNAIKELLGQGEYIRAKMIWDDLPEALRLALWRAPSKGGVFDTWERDALKNGEIDPEKTYR